MGNEMKFRHPEMRAVMEEVRGRMATCGTFRNIAPRSRRQLFCRFARPLADRHPRDVTWSVICKVGWERRSAAGVALLFALTLLDEGMLEPAIADALRTWRPHVERALEHEGGQRLLLPLFLCGGCLEWLADDPGAAAFAVSMFSPSLRESFAELGDGALNPAMLPVLADVAESYYGGRDLGDVPDMTLGPFKRFFARYAPRRPQDISWEEECAAYSKSNGCRWHLLALFTALLERGLYARDHREALEGLAGTFRAMLSANRKTHAGAILCGEDVEFLCALPANIARRKLGYPQFMMIRTRSAYLRSVLVDFLQEEGTLGVHATAEKVDVLLRGMGDAADGIARLEDFTASLFWRQALFIRDEFADDAPSRTGHAGFLRSFYQFLTELDPERDLFENAANLSSELVHNASLTGYIANDYLVTSYHPGIDLGDARRVVLIMRGYDDLSTGVEAEDSVIVDLSSLESAFYRQEVLAFACRSPRALISAAGHQVPHLCRALQALFEAKSRDGYPDPSLQRISCSETALLRRGADRAFDDPSTRSSALSSVSVFLQWERDARGRIAVEEFAVDHLRGLSKKSGKSSARSIPEDDLARIAPLLAERARESLEWALANAVFHLLLQTEMRVGQICHLEVGCVRATAKPNEHVVCSTSKTSGGEREEFVITQRTLDVLNGAVDATDEVRRRFAARSAGRYIFIYQDWHRRLRRMTGGKFSKMLAGCCAELGIDPPYTANNLRDTHSTMAVGFATGEDGEALPGAALLTGHASLETDYRHYVDVDVQRMVEATFDVIIGDRLIVDADGKVAEAVPEEASGADRVVEGGCGCCTAQYCSVTSPLPCLVCESFVTTVEHEPFFVRAIEAVDAQLASAASRHDAEDLTFTKGLLAAFLAAIGRRKEGRSHG